MKDETKENGDSTESYLKVANSDALVEEEEANKSGLRVVSMLGRHYTLYTIQLYYILILYLHFRYRNGGVPCLLYHWHFIEATNLCHFSQEEP